jgi:hypothetical protein
MATPLVAPAIANAVAEFVGARDTDDTVAREEGRGKVMASSFGFEEQGNERD